MKFPGILLAILFILQEIQGKAYYVKLHQSPQNAHSCVILQEEPIRQFRGFSTQDENEVKIIMRNAVDIPGDSKKTQDHSKIFEIFAKNKEIATTHVQVLCKSWIKEDHLSSIYKINEGEINFDDTLAAPAPEIFKLVDGGDQENRIDVVFMGDGYQESERQKFLDDMTRLTKDMFEGPTFRSYLPLFNIWAIFVASVDSGIGYFDEAKNTPFKLYREGGTLRVIWPGDTSNARRVCALNGPSGCDFPSIIANDDFYGGLGGEFVISTSSNRTGTVVLRHEMGHSFGNFGDEYDNSWAYDGANSARDVETLGWSHWLSGAKKEERAIYRILAYPWADLSKGAQNFSFTSDGNYSRWYLVVTVSAAGEEDCLEFSLDGKVLPWESSGFDDREFYDWYGNERLTAGNHTFSVRSKTNSTHPQIPRMICSVWLHELGTEEEFHISNDYISAYPTWNDQGTKLFRPTNAGCLMRNMSHTSFCPVCKEGLWMQFLQRLSLIDSVHVSSTVNPDGSKNVTLSTIKLGSLRSQKFVAAGETLEVRWSRGDVEREDLRNLFEIQAQPGNWSVSVNFTTPEIRSDPQGLTQETSSFTVV